MSGPTIRIDNVSSMPEISAVQDFGNSIEISNLDDFDLGLLGNQRKLGGTPTRLDAPAQNDIEFVNLEDTQVTFDVKPPVNNGSGDTIRILRDTSAPMKLSSEPSLTLNSGPQTSGNNFYNSPPATGSGSGSGSGSSATATATAFSGTTSSGTASAPPAKSWFSSLTGAGAGSSTTTSDTNAGGFRSWFSGGAGSGSGSGSGSGAAQSEQGAVTSDAPAYRAYLTPEQESAKKTEGLTLLERMDRKGVTGTKMTAANSLDEINAELAKRKDSKGLEASIRFQRSMLTTVTSGMEFLNSRYDPLGVALDGWSEQVNENIEDYDEIFEELYDKYKDKSKVAPEVRLIMSLGLSAAMCHVTNTMFKSRMPGMDDILRKNPELAKQMAKAAAEHAVGPGFANFVSMGMSSGNRGGEAPPMRSAAPPQPMRQQYEESQPMDEQGMFTTPPMGSGIGAPIPNMDPRGGVTIRREMRGPSGVDDILRTLNAAGESPPSRSVPPVSTSIGGIDADEVNSVGSGMTTETMRRAGVSRRRKATTTQPTGATLTLNV